MDKGRRVYEILETWAQQVRRTERYKLDLAEYGWRNDKGATRREKKLAKTPRIAQNQGSSEAFLLTEVEFRSASQSTARTRMT